MKYPLVELLLLAAIWGASFIFMRVGVPELGAFFFMFARTGIAALSLWPVLLLKNQTHHLTGKWTMVLLASLFNTAIPFALFGFAAYSLAAGTASVLNATTPIFTAIVSYFWLSNKLSWSQVAGLIIGFIGVYLLMMKDFSMQAEQTLWPTLAVLGATLCYGIGTNMTKKYLSDMSALAMTTASQTTASLTLLPLALYFMPTAIPSIKALGAVVVIGVLCTGLAYIIFFRLMNQISVTYAVSVTYLIPVFGILWGVLLLNEQVTLNTFIGCGTILLGVALTTNTLQRLIKPLFSKNKQLV